jgi:hypothetical protein
MTRVRLFYEPTIRRHAASVLLHFPGVTLRDIGGVCKRWLIVDARHHLWFRLVVVEKWSLPETARRISVLTRQHCKDHTSVLHGVRRVGQELYGTAANASLEDIRSAYRAAFEAHVPVKISENKAEPEAAA